MLSFLVELVNTMSEQEIDTLTKINTKAYAEDNPWEVMIGGDWSLSEDLARAMIRATLLEGQIYVVKTQNGKIVSFGLWFKPQTAIFSTAEQRKLGFDEFFAKLKPEVKYWYTHTYPEIAQKYAEPLFTDEEKKKRWWCYNLATDPEYQGLGCATTLVDHVYQVAVKAEGFIGLATALELNLKKYLSMAFHERGSFLMPSPISDTTNHVLTRESQGPE
ncbi:hypothetical protein D9758_017951 [Tetrapyrgos nigripes]|uniref:N-acetyltransferase domain-containing protein n=1 Tax=Tetrapyrgos nigripes TaxID=182062 RepID=A0A8H5F9X6_9AGAR|nr:hypothetical protein D9758_017951 [Tetrapyrgos nigripes]